MYQPAYKVGNCSVFAVFHGALHLQTVDRPEAIGFYVLPSELPVDPLLVLRAAAA